MIWSLPVELSLTRTIFWSEPAATEASVSFRVWLLRVELPGREGVDRVEVALEVDELDVDAGRRRRCLASSATCQGNQPGQALKPSLIGSPEALLSPPSSSLHSRHERCREHYGQGKEQEFSELHRTLHESPGAKTKPGTL